jgi:hypothetical protein
MKTESAATAPARGCCCTVPLLETVGAMIAVGMFFLLTVFEAEKRPVPGGIGPGL